MTVEENLRYAMVVFVNYLLCRCTCDTLTHLIFLCWVLFVIDWMSPLARFCAETRLPREWSSRKKVGAVP